MPQTITQGLLDPAIAIPDSYLANGAEFIKRNGSVAFTGNISLGNNRITGLGNGTGATDAINLGQLQAYINGLHIHFARLVQATNLTTLSGLAAIDGITPTAGDEVFLIGQTTQSQNGPWLVASGAWTRPPDWATGSIQTEGHYWIIEPDGTTYKNSKWFLANVASVTVDTTAVTFQQDLSGTAYTFSNGLVLSGTSVTTKRGNGISLDGSDQITVTPDPNRMLQTIAAGVGIKDGTAAQLLMANSAGNASYQTMSGDATISSAGALTVNHTAGSGFLKYTDAVANEVPGGTPNGAVTAFTLASAPQVTSLSLYKNGTLQKPGAGNDYTISGINITMLSAPLTGDQLLASYLK
jgi:hypothetical protein